MRSALVLFCALGVSACDWVDSTGNRTGEPVVQSDAIFVDEQPIGGAARVLEDRRVPVVVARAGIGDPALDYRVSDGPVESGVLDVCLGRDGFTEERAAGSFEEACSADGDCTLAVIRDDAAAAADGTLAFELQVPALRAPVGLRYTLTYGRNLTGEDGESRFVEDDVRDLTFCLVSINEAPIAVDDSYVVIAGDTLEVGREDGLLANDRDDDDVGNAPLEVVSEPALAPSAAASFELFTDGGFRYESFDDGSGADRLDRFVYTITDGLDRATGSVSVRVVVGNRAPVQVEDLPVIEIAVDEEVQIDLARAFSDPDERRLTYTLEPSLPDDGSLELSDDGLLSGVPDDDDAGEYALTLIVDNGGASLDVPLTLRIEGPPADLPPVYSEGSVFDQSIRLGARIQTIEPEFEDPEGELLEYRFAGTTPPAGVAIDQDDGTVDGRPRRRGLTQGLIVEAIDPGGQSAFSEPFSIRVR